METRIGKPYPLGVTYDGQGVNVALFSSVATKVEFCVFDRQGKEIRHALPERTGPVWHGYFPGVWPSTQYGFRVHGPWDPKNGIRCDPNYLLLDPYARAIDGLPKWDMAMFPRLGSEGMEPSGADTAEFSPRCIVVDNVFNWAGDGRPDTPLHESVIYEAHVKGFTMRHPDIPDELRGTYAGLTHPAAVEYLQRLGVTAIELLPVHQFVHDQSLLEKGLRQFWGYNTIGYFAPHNEYAASGQRGEQVAEFKNLVKTMHRAGIEVILDVVYNHTAEGNHMGPVLSMKGIDNSAYYRVVGKDKRYYMDYTGTGNTLNVTHPHVLQLIMDSLRYWVTEMHVDGFRFDLAATLARELHEVDRLGSFFDTIHQDPVLNRVKLIAEPWDVGEGGYQLGNFPPQWSEWNDLYRDTMRDFWRGEGGKLGDFAFRFTGSSDLYENSGRRPYASVNFVTAHDGFCLRDVVSYNEKHNEANGEGGKDGHNDNRSWNCGVEGPTDDESVNRLRMRMQKSFLTTLLLSHGVPMIQAGDELSRTKNGNNNTYCQDNELTWIDWGKGDEHLLAFTRKLIALRRRHPVFRRRKWFQGRAIFGEQTRELIWLRPDGQEMSQEDWNTGYAKCLAVLLDGRAMDTTDEMGHKVQGHRFCLLFNAAPHPMTFKLPQVGDTRSWMRVVDTADGIEDFDEDAEPLPTDEIEVTDRAVVVLRDVDA